MAQELRPTKEELEAKSQALRIMAESKEKTKEDTEATPDQQNVEATDADLEAKDEENVEVKPTEVRLKEVGTKGGGRALLLKGLAVVVFLGVACSAYFYLKDGVEIEVPEKVVESAEQELGLDPSLSARELVQFGLVAFGDGDLDQASRFYEGARLRADLEATNDINLTIDVYMGMSNVEEARGNSGMATMYREYIQSKQAEIGSSLPIYNKAEKLFREGDQVGARKYFAQFLLLSGSLGDSGKRYVDNANRRIADSLEIEYRERYAKVMTVSLTNPEEFFNEKR